MQHPETWKHGPPTSYPHVSLDTLSLPHQEELWTKKRQEDNYSNTLTLTVLLHVSNKCQSYFVFDGHPSCLPWEVQGKSHLYRWSPTKSFSANSSMVVPWHPTAFLPLVSPRRVTTIWGFLKASLPTEAVTMSPGVTLVASKFNLPMEVVTVNTHHLSSSASLDGVRGSASLTTDLVVGTT